MWGITVDVVLSKSICEKNRTHKKDSLVSVCLRSMLPSLVSRPAASALPGTLLKRQILCHIPDLLNENPWELARSSPFYQSSPGDSDAPQHLRVTIIKHLHKAINHENPETISLRLCRLS